MDEVESVVREYILEEFLAGESPDELTASTPLVTGGILNSLGTLKLVMFLEERYKIELQSHETDADHMNTICDIVSLVRSKLSLKQ
jgi:acyl carrier protein